jgi:acetyltransferase-like isoleucine patch superfamily enzyme
MLIPAKIFEIILRRIKYYIIKFNSLITLDRILVKGGECDIKGVGFISCSKSISFGNNVHIGEDFYFATEGGMMIGDNTHISRRVTIYTHNHNYNGESLPYDQNKQFKPVNIGKNVWIGMNVSVCPGVSIGEGSIIGMGSVVAKDIPPYSISGGNPARVLGQRNIEKYKYLEQNSSYGGKNGAKRPESKAKYCTLSELGENLCFVLSTGRSGSQSIVDTLSSHSLIQGYHEPFRYLIKLSTDFAHKLKTCDEVSKELEILFNQLSCFPKDKMIIISDQKFSNLVSFIKKMLPKAKFIHLKRKPEQCINSIYAREWYAEKVKLLKKSTAYWHGYRLSGANVGEFSELDWGNLDRWEKCCWYYKYWNELIEANIADINESQKLSITLENLDENIFQVCEFLGIKNESLSIKRSNTVKEAHLKLYEKNWSPKQKQIFNRYFK